MSQYRGYTKRSLEFLKDNDLQVGDHVKIHTDLIYKGVIMSRYEHADDLHVTLKLDNGYNIGIEIKDIKRVVKLEKKLHDIPKQEIKSDPSLPKILLLTTGGTIASKIDYRTGAVTPIQSAADLSSSIPELSNIANIKTETILAEYSENLQPQDWKKIGEKLDSYANSDYKGIIIAHGTDTMQYTAAFLSFALAGYPIPVALVGSQRSSDRPSSDAASNLLSATKFLLNTDDLGIFIVMHNDDSDETIACHLGTRARKNHTSKRGAFQTIGGSPAFLITGNDIQKNISKKFFSTSKYTPALGVDTKVGLVKYYPGYDPKLVDEMIKLGYKAIIFEGTGLGHVGKTMYDVIKKLNDAGIFLAMTSQCIDGRVTMTVYESGRDLLKLGIIPLGNMIPEIALVKAMWVLGNYEKHEIKQIMLQNISSEYCD